MSASNLYQAPKKKANILTLYPDSEWMRTFVSVSHARKRIQLLLNYVVYVLGIPLFVWPRARNYTLLHFVPLIMRWDWFEPKAGLAF